MALIQKVLDAQGFNVDFQEYKVTTKREITRPINPKNKNGPSEKVLLEEKVSVSAHIKYLRQLQWRAAKDPENLLLVQIERLKGEPVSVPLIFGSLLAEQRPILVTGLTKTVHSQLLAKPDPSFATIPEPVASDPVALEEILSRSKRKKGMQSTAREIMDLQGFKPEVAQIIVNVATAKPVPLSDAEAVNLILISDLFSRYQPLLVQFFQDLSQKSQPPQALAKQFSLLLEGVPVAGLVKKFSPYLEVEKSYKTLEALFGGLYAWLQAIKDKPSKDSKLSPTSLFSWIKGLSVLARCQQDPDLWSQCQFFFALDDERSPNAQSVEALVQVAQKIKNEALKAAATGNQSLQDLYDAGNADRYLQEFGLHFAQASPEDRGFLEQVLSRQFGYHLAVAGNPILQLFTAAQPAFPELQHPLPSLGAVYGHLLFRRLEALTQTFFSPGLESLTQRFGDEFFDICYFKCVFEQALPVSRKQFAGWLRHQGLVTDFGALGYQEDLEEKPLDEWITDEVLRGSGDSIVAKEIGPDEFKQGFLKAEQNYRGFLAKLQSYQFKGGEELNPAKILLQTFGQGLTDISSPLFRKALKGTYLAEELEEVIENSTTELREEMEQAAKARKLVLVLPESLCGFFYLAQRFNLRGPTGTIKVHLLIGSQKKSGHLSGLNKTFAANLTKYLQESTDPYRQGLVQCISMLNEYQKSSQEYLRYLGILFFDRFLSSYHELQTKKSTQSPEHIKFWFPDGRKMVLGHTKQLALGKLLNPGGERAAKDGQPIANQSLAQFLQGIYYYHAAQKGLNNWRKKVGQLRKLFGRFSQTMRESEEYIQYDKLLANFAERLSKPIPEFTDRYLTDLGDLTSAMKTKLESSEGVDSPVTRLYKEWMARNPQDEVIIKPYKAFSHERHKGDNFLMELASARDLLGQLANKRCLIFALDGGKKNQLDQVVEILPFLRQVCPEAAWYLEDSNLDPEAKRHLAKHINPAHFFAGTKLEPKPKPQQG